MSHRVVFIPGDGIGPEVAEAARRCLEATGVAFEWTVCVAGEAAIAKHGTPLPEETLQGARGDQRADYHAHRHGVSLRERGLAQATGFVRLHPTLPLLRRGSRALPSRRS